MESPLIGSVLSCGTLTVHGLLKPAIALRPTRLELFLGGCLFVMWEQHAFFSVFVSISLG